MPITLAPNADLAHTITAEVTVEAEYGSIVIEGTRYTAAHHGGEWAGRPAPCNDAAVPVVGDAATLLVSHLDLDTFGGCLRALGADLFGPETRSFWALAEFVDLRGPHKLGQSGASETDLESLYAFWAWAKVAVPRLSRDEITDVTGHVQAAGDALRGIFAGDDAMLDAGREFRAAETALNVRTFERADGPVIVRVAEVAADFCNHLYATPSGSPARAVACYNREFGSVTLSLADPEAGVSCREMVQAVWGSEAGGHDGIAGSPRGLDVGEEGLEAAVVVLAARLGR